MTRPVHLVLGATLAVSAAAADPPTPRIALEERARAEVVADWPIQIEPTKKKHADECAAMTAADLRVFESGEETPSVVDLDRRRRPAVHVLMLDSSRSMTGPETRGRRKGRQVRIAAKTYIDWMVPRPEARLRPEELMLFTFDEDLILRIPRTTVPDAATASRLKSVVEDMTSGYDTAIWDSLHQLIHALSTDRTAVVLLSDGADNVSRRTFETVSRLADEKNYLSIFPVALNLGKSRFRRTLETLAEASGGAFFFQGASEIEYLDRSLSGKFDKIRRRLEREAYVSWAARSHGELPGDAQNLDEEGGLLRKIRIESKRPNCRVFGYKRTRYLPGTEPPADEPPSPDEPPAVVRREQRLELNVVDIVQDRGPLLVYASDKPTGNSLRALELVRPVEIEIPPLERVRASLHRPEDVLRRWLEQGRSPLASELPEENPGDVTLDLPSFPSRHLLQGDVFLEVRERIAEALFDRFDDYRAWMRARMAVDLRAELERKRSADTPARVLEATLAYRVDHPRPEMLRRYLTSWRTDVLARDVAFALERDWANELLEADASDRSGVRERAEAGWARLLIWLRPPDGVRIFVPLTLTYDPETERFGFHRVVAPRPKRWARESLTERPYTLHLVSWMVEGDASIRESWRVAEAEHRPKTFEGDTPGDLRVVAVTLQSRNDPAERATLTVWAYATPEGNPVPECFVPADDEASRGLEQHLRERGVPRCLVSDGN